MTTTTDVHPVTPADDGRVAHVLALAFLDDPVFRFVYPDDDRRRQVLPGFFGIVAPVVGRLGATAIAGNGVGTALWVPPDATPADDDVGARLDALAPEAAARLAAVGRLLDETHPREPHWYLNYLAVAPEHQGLGVGAALLRPALARCDAAGEPAYLEATTEHNRRLYERHGFVTTGELQVPDGPTMFAMWRSPAP